MNIRDLTIEELKTKLENMNEQKYRSTQIFDWLHNKTILSTFKAYFKVLKNI